jgi:septal ring factor EnvC (AmiA/AmiB activator)
VLEVETARLRNQLEAAQAAASQAAAAAAAAERQGYDRWQAAMRQRMEVSRLGQTTLSLLPTFHHGLWQGISLFEIHR